VNTAANPALRQLRRLFPPVPLMGRYVNSFGRVTRHSENAQPKRPPSNLCTDRRRFDRSARTLPERGITVLLWRKLYAAQFSAMYRSIKPLAGFLSITNRPFYDVLSGPSYPIVGPRSQ
jgi:hypothetical protein